MHAVFDESRIFRIDHFLGKESVDNILAFRFANGLFEPIWNRKHIKYVQIDVPETLTVEQRAGFYDATGAYRDMVVTHLFQVLGFIAMEPPTSLDAKPLRDEKGKVFDALRPIDMRHVVRGQYEGYRSIHGVPADSDTETMIALRVEVENWRWHGVPFYLRSGKALKESTADRSRSGSTRRRCGCSAPTGTTRPRAAVNEIVIDFADPGSISIEFMAKMPGPEMTLGASKLTLQVRGLVRGGQRPGGLRAADPARHARRPVAVHQGRRHRAGLGNLRAAARPLPRRCSRTRWAPGARPRWRS